MRSPSRLTRLAAHLSRVVDNPESAPAFVWPRWSRWRRLRDAVEQIVTEQRRLTSELADQRAWRHQLVEALAQPALLFSSDTRLVAANQAARLLLQLEDDAVGLTMVRAIGNVALVDAIREAQGAAVAGSEGRLTLDLDHLGRDLRVNVTVIGAEALVIIVDRTRERQVEELRRNFVVNASHELKTPVTSIQALAEALQVVVSVDQQRAARLVARLSVDAEHLAKLVRDLLDLRRLEEAGPLEQVAVDVAELARRVIADLQPIAEHADITLSIDAPERAVIAGVPTDIEAIIKNLIENAIRYNRPTGEVAVSIVPGDGEHVLKVSDTGIGIPPQDLGRIFERFYRVDVARSRSTGGTGLGLSIVRHAVERHNGTVEVDSEIGHGSTFTVRLPVGSDR